MRKPIAIIMLNWNGTRDTIACLDSLKAHLDLYDIFLLDNASEASQEQLLAEHLRQITDYRVSFLTDKAFSREDLDPACDLYYITSGENLGFAGGNNYVSSMISPEYPYVLLLNNDTVVEGNAIGSMLELIRKEGHAAVTCDIRVFDKPDTQWSAGGKFTWYCDRKYYPKSKIDRLKAQGVTAIAAEFVTGCALLIDSTYIQKNGLFTDLFFHGEEDYDFCLKVKENGKTIGVDLTAIIYHKVGRSIHRQANAKRLCSNVLHYTNRLVDYKYRFGRIKWTLWKEFYLLLLAFRKLVARRDNLHHILLVNRKIRYYARRYDHVRKDVFQKIMSDPDLT